MERERGGKRAGERFWRTKDWDRETPITRRVKEGCQREYPKEFSIFVDNLPKDLDNFGLKGIFKRFGSITDAYIPRKIGEKSRRRFGFVRFGKKGSAEEALKIMNKRHIRGRQIETYWARFQKRKFEKQMKQGRRQVWIQKPRIQTQKKENQGQFQNNEGFIATIEGEICEDTSEWLKRSLVCKSKYPLAVESLETAVKLELPKCLKVTDMGCFKAVLTFGSQEEAIATMQDQSAILEIWFDEVKPWDELDCCETRQAWLELYGVPGHGWSRDNIEKVVGCWGELAYVDYGTMEVSSFKVARALIDTTQMKTIEGDVLLTLGTHGYRVTVRETSSAVWQTEHNQLLQSLNNQDHQHLDEGQQPQHDDDSTKVPDSQSQGKVDEELRVQTCGSTKNQQASGDVVSSSRTYTSPLLGSHKIDENRVDLIATPIAHNDNDSEATIEATFEAHLGERRGAVNASGPFRAELVSSPYNSKRVASVECRFNDILEEFEKSRKSQKSKKKKAKRLKEKCRSFQKEINIGNELIMEAQTAWEMSKAAGLAAKNSDAEMIEAIARDMALEALENTN